MIKIGAIVRCYYITEYLKRVLKHLKDLDSIAVMNYRFNRVKEAKDNTQEIVKELKQDNVKLFTGEGLEQHEIFNKGLERLNDCDFVFILDADEFLLKFDRKKIIDDMTEKGFGYGFAKVIDYRDLEHIYPIRTHKPVVCVKPIPHKLPQNVFYQVRNVMGASGSQLPDVYLHHFGYALNKENMEWKKNNLWYILKEGEENELNRIMAQDYRPYVMPEELKEIING